MSRLHKNPIDELPDTALARQGMRPVRVEQHRKGDTVAKRLTEWERLHRADVITNEQFQAAEHYSQLLRSMGSPSAMDSVTRCQSGVYGGIDEEDEETAARRERAVRERRRIARAIPYRCKAQLADVLWAGSKVYNEALFIEGLEAIAEIMD